MKYLADDPAFGGEQHRIAGDHIRAKIKAAKRQMQTAADKRCGAILLVMNTLDGLQMFETEPTDFSAAMDGEFSVEVCSDRTISEPYHGRNRMFREDSKTAFSGLGAIIRTRGGVLVTIYANRHARYPLVTSGLPAPFVIHFCSPLEAEWVMG